MARVLMFVLLRCIVATGLVFVFILSVQEFLIFPGLGRLESLNKTRAHASLPAGIVSDFVVTGDGERIEVWFNDAAPIAGRGRRVAILFHGNADVVESAVWTQRWLASEGISSYSFDYRGFGKSSGWPSEEGIYQDSESVWRYVQAREQLPAGRMILFSWSVGTGFAAVLAAKVSPGALVLVSPYASLRKAIHDTSVYGNLSGFARYEVSTVQAVAALSSTCLIVAHGNRDTVIPVQHGREVVAAYQGKIPPVSFFQAAGDHGNILSLVQGKIMGALNSCIP